MFANFFTARLHARERDADYFALILLTVLSVATFSNTLASSAYIRDDRYIIVENPLLWSWISLPKLLTTGYWEGALGAEAPVQEFRPVLMFSYALTTLLFGLIPWIFHLANLLIHAANVLLLFLLLKRHYSYAVALGAGALFAVLPVHVEAIAYLSGRSELLVCFFLLLTWLELDLAQPKVARGVFWFSCALLSKEQAVLFPAVLAAGDWAFHGRLFWRKPRRGLYSVLAISIFVCLAIRSFVLTNPFHGGSDYFAGRPYLVKLLTMSVFSFEHYLLPMITGRGLQSEFVRPFFPDAEAGHFGAWLFLVAWTALFAAASAELLRRRARWAFWTLAGLVWILPVSNLVIHLDTLGAERFLYLPSLGFCVVLSQLAFLAMKSRNAAVLVAVLAVWYGISTFRRNRVWATDLAYYQQAVSDNPLSAGARSGLGVALLDKGEKEQAERFFRAAVALKPSYAPGYYNLGKIYYERGDWAQSEGWFKEALARESANVDTWLFLGLLEERRENLQAAIDRYQKAASLQPWNSLAHFNLGRLFLRQGRNLEARGHFERFLSLSPGDSEAQSVRQLLIRLRG